MKNFNKMMMGICAFAVLASYGTAHPDGTATPASGPNDITVTLKAHADMASYRDSSLRDVFTANLSDKQVITDFKIMCQSAKSGFWKRQDQECSVGGNGQIVNPTNGKAYPRTVYSGGYVTRLDGYADASQINVNYLALGNVPAASGTFHGSMNLKPQLASAGAMAIRDMMTSYLQTKSNKGDLIDNRIDSVHFSNYGIPSAGFPSDKGCTVDGDMVFYYQTNQWLIDINAKAGDKDVHLKGNMGWPEISGGHRYDLNLVIPTAQQASDASLFAAPEGGDLFAQTDGISGQIIQKEGGKVTTKVDGVDTDVSTQIDITGDVTGHNVPVECVRGVSQTIFILSRTFFGA